MKNNNLSVVILTMNEEANIAQALDSLVGWTDNVFVLDSGSTDNTVLIAQEYGAKCFFRKFDNYGSQRQHAITKLPIESEWILFLDADEYVTNELKCEIDNELLTPKADGYLIKFKFIFMGKWLKHGGFYGTRVLRLFRHNKASISRNINEHVLIDGVVSTLKNDFIHADNKGLSDWLDKHNRYSSFEAQELLNYDYRVSNSEKLEGASLFGPSPQRKRWIRENIWNKFLGPYSRPVVYFIYRYVVRCGFLDGKAGFAYSLLHSFMMVLSTGLKYEELKMARRNTVVDNK